MKNNTCNLKDNFGFFSAEDNIIKEKDFIFSKEQIVQSAFDWYRENGFPYKCTPKHICMQQLNILTNISLDSTLAITRVGYNIADTYHPHRYAVPCNERLSVVDGFNDDTILKKQLEKALKLEGEIGTGYFQELGWVAGPQAASNFRPGFALMLYRKFCPEGGIILDTSTGFGGRLVGFIAYRKASAYIGIDPNTRTYSGNERLLNDLAPKQSANLICEPIEDVDSESFKGCCDYALTSPPYFCKEKYSEEDTQSWVRYSTPKKWRDGFLGPMLEFQYKALRPGSINTVIIADIKIKSELLPLVEWTEKIGQKIGFKMLTPILYPLTRRPGNRHPNTKANEVGVCFQKSKRYFLS